MSWNSMSRLGCDVVLGDIQAQNISCKSITVDDQTDPTIPTEITVNTINAGSGNFEDEITCPVFHCPNEYDSQNISNPKCTNGITIGTKDGNGYNYEDVNLQINSWNSSGFVDTDNKICNLTIDHRNGNLQTKGNITASSADFDVINVNTLNVSNPSEPTDLNVSSLTATTGNIENLTTNTITSTSVSVSSSVACNSLSTQNTSSDDITVNNILNVAGSFEALTATIESTIPLLGLNAITTGDYLQQISGDDDSHFSLLQLSSGDSGSQGLILTAGGSYGTGENSIQSFDSMRNNGLTLNLNPLGGKVVTDHLTYTNGNKPVQANPLYNSVNMEVLFYHLTGDSNQTTATMTLANNINGTTNYAVFPSIYFGIADVSGGTYHVFDSYMDINVSNFTETQFFCNIKKSTGDNMNVYIQFLVIYDMVGTDFPKSY